MDEQKPSSSTTSNTNFLTTPVAIVVSGALIALALYFGGVGAASQPANNNPAAQPAAVPAAGQPGQPAVPTVGAMRAVSSDDHIRGPQNAKVTIVEYSDLECPFCKRFHTTLQQVVADYPNDVRWVYRHFPLEQLHQKAKPEAMAAECAGEQGKFWEFIDLVFETTQGNDSLDLDTMPQLAQQVGVANISQFEACVESEKYKERVEADLADAAAAGGRGTPYSVIIGPEGQKLPISGAQPIDAVKKSIDSLL